MSFFWFGKNLPAMQEAWARSLVWEDPLEKRKATHYSILAWRIPLTVKSIGLQRVGPNWVTFTLVWKTIRFIIWNITSISFSPSVTLIISILYLITLSSLCSNVYFMYFISLSLHIIYYADFFVPTRLKLEIFQTLWESILSLHLAPSLHAILFCEVGLFLAHPIFSSYIYFHIYSVWVCVCMCITC